MYLCIYVCKVYVGVFSRIYIIIINIYIKIVSNNLLCNYYYRIHYLIASARVGWMRSFLETLLAHVYVTCILNVQ